ncbi:MAG: DUF3078 domain-containing protein [Bacteroidales bacterium]
MKRLIVTIAFSLVCLTSFAQNTDDAQKAAAEAAAAISKAPELKEAPPKPNYWTNTLLTKINFGQTSLTNWAAGGNNSVSLQSFLDGNANYSKDNVVWSNRLQLDYGFIYSADKPFIQKSNDRIYYESKYAYKAAKSLNYSALFSFKSQFTNSYTYPVPSNKAGEEPTKSEWMDARLLKSGLFSPAYTDLGFGISWVPSKWLTVNIAPITGGFVIVSNDALRPTYSMELRKLNSTEQAEYDEAIKQSYPNAIAKGNAIGKYYKWAKFEFGAKVTIDAKFNINNNFNYTTQLVLFSDYLENPQNLRVNWDNRFDWKVAKYFSFMIVTNLIYDDKIYIVQDSDKDEFPSGRRRVQFKESMSFGFSYTFASKKK